MANYKTVALGDVEYRDIINAIRDGFEYIDDEGNKRKFRKNLQLSTILQLEALLGLRISDILKLCLSDFIQDGNRYRLDNIIEKKTGKHRSYTVPKEVYSFLCQYAMERGIGKNNNLFAVGERAVQKQLAIVAKYCNIERISTHSFRKRFATRIYENSNCNLELTRQVMQHSSIAITQRYIGVSSKQIEDALVSVSDDLL